MKLVLIYILLASSFAVANCKVYIPKKEFLHQSGLTIRFDFTKALSKNGYQETYISNGADFELLLQGQELDTSPFRRAMAKFEFVHLTSKESLYYERTKLCLTQFCAISDFAKAFNRSLLQLTKELPRCSEFQR